VIRQLINGAAAESIASTDRGLLYGDGLFETVAVLDGAMASWPRHLRRLQAGCTRLGLPLVEKNILEEECRSLSVGSDKAVLKIVITRGIGGRGYRVAEKTTATRVVQLHEWPAFAPACAEQGIAVRVCDIRLGQNPLLAGIKHLNRLEQVLARQEWDDPLVMEGLLLDADDHLVEGTMSNLFLVRDGVLVTPDLHQCGVAGIMRTRILEMAGRLPIDAKIRNVDVTDLYAADEVFVCNSLIGIWPVIAEGSRVYKKGTVTSRLQTMLETVPDCGDSWLIG